MQEDVHRQAYTSGYQPRKAERQRQLTRFGQKKSRWWEVKVLCTCHTALTVEDLVGAVFGAVEVEQARLGVLILGPPHVHAPALRPGDDEVAGRTANNDNERERCEVDSGQTSPALESQGATQNATLNGRNTAKRTRMLRGCGTSCSTNPCTCDPAAHARTHTHTYTKHKLAQGCRPRGYTNRRIRSTSRESDQRRT